MLRNRQRFDVTAIGDNVERTPQGGLAIPAFLTRAGVFDYVQDDGSVIKEYRPPEEVFNGDSLATLPNAPLANEHPREPIAPHNYKRHNVGHVVDGSVKQDTDKIAAKLVFQEKGAIDDILGKKKRELSCGYNCDVDETPGTAPNGERYDRIQRNIRYNHVALVSDGRAGPEVRLRLDSKSNQRRDNSEGESMDKIEIIGGVEYVVGTPGHADAVKRRSDAKAQRADSAAKAKKERDQLQARADSLATENKKLKDQLAAALSPQRLDHAVAVRAAVIRRARVALGADFKLDGLSIAEIKAAAVKKYHEGVRLDGKSADYVNGMFRAIPAAATRRNDGRGGNSRNASLRLDGSNRVDGDRVPADLREPPEGFERQDAGGPRGRGMTMQQIRERRNDAEETRHRRPLLMSKSNPHRENDSFPSVQGSMLENMR